MEILLAKVKQVINQTLWNAIRSVHCKRPTEHDVTFEDRIPAIVSGLGRPAGIIGTAHSEVVAIMSLRGDVIGLYA